MSMRSPLARARGLGSAKSGTMHFWWQRVTAIALVPLTVWMMVALIGAAGSDYASAHAFVANPLVATLTLALIVALFHHAQLGLQVVIEDYVHVEWVKLTALLLVKFTAIVLALMSAIAVVRIAAGG
jgi:succinate dehydrogenase / fumarate reductase, membrane anchor subunit